MIALSEPKSLGPVVTTLSVNWVQLSKDALQVCYSAGEVVDEQFREAQQMPTLSLSGEELTAFFDAVAGGEVTGATLRAALVSALEALVAARYDA